MAHDHAAMKTAASHGAGHCDHQPAKAKCCCPDKGACGDTCQQKCFGQLAVVPAARALHSPAARPLAEVAPPERPPGWASPPQPPPPRA